MMDRRQHRQRNCREQAKRREDGQQNLWDHIRVLGHRLLRRYTICIFI